MLFYVKRKLSVLFLRIALSMTFVNLERDFCLFFIGEIELPVSERGVSPEFTVVYRGLSVFQPIAYK